MPFIAICPYCSAGRVRAPESTLGLTAPCPNCKTSFTLIDSGFTDTEDPQPAYMRPVVAAPAPETKTAVATKTTAAPALQSPKLADDDEPVEWDTSDWLRLPTIIALACAGVALIASQIPYGRFGTVALAAMGLVVGLLAAYGSQQLKWPLIASGLNAAVLLVVSLLPTWLGIETWRPAPVDHSKTVPQAFNEKGLQPTSEWTDVSNAWQFDDVRVRLIVTNEQIELTGPKEKKQFTKTSYLRVRVAVRNVGVARRIDVQDWSAPTPMKLADAAGKVIEAAKFQGEWLPTLRRKHKPITPGESVEHDYLFEAPVNTVAYLRLEMPGEPCGLTGVTIRFQIPTRPLGLRSSEG